MERREYKRVDAEDECVIFNVDDSQEYPAKIRDISEDGICFELPADAKLKAGQKLKFQFMTEVTAIQALEDGAVVEGEATFVRLEKGEPGKMIAGCKVSAGADSFREYVENIKVRGFLQRLNNNRK